MLVMRFAISCCHDDIKMEYVMLWHALGCSTEHFAVHVCVCLYFYSSVCMCVFAYIFVQVCTCVCLLIFLF